ncbi:MAG: efflux RND transporter periplasmic adaptor subunit [Acidimicrobiia bacterium]|nr:efflux RND transporter periplasmic adaptor subunit [Acidimicrobiia bacterium]
MKRSIIVVAIVAAVGAGGYWYAGRAADGGTAGTENPSGAGAFGRGGGGPGGGGGRGGFGGPRLPMTVEVGQAKRANMTAKLTVVGNLVAAATVEATPKVGGRLESVAVRLGDRVGRGQRLAKIEDQELLEQIKQAEASYEVAAATIRQREADLRLAQTNLDRSRNLYERQLIPRQTFDDTDARFQSAAAQLDLARAQFSQAQARLDELKINLANSVIVSPVSGFIGRRILDPGAWVTPNSSFLSVVDISTVRLVAPIVERDLAKISSRMPANVEVDAFPGETFAGRIAHVAPVLDPATRTAPIEIDIPNPQFRLKPGMYATVDFTTDRRDNTLVVPTKSVVDFQGNRGVFLPTEGDVAKFKPVELGMIDGDLAEVTSGLTEGDRIVTTGAAALREGDKIVLAGQNAGGRGGPGGRGGRGGPAGPGEGPPGRSPSAGGPGGAGEPERRLDGRGSGDGRSGWGGGDGSGRGGGMGRGDASGSTTSDGIGAGGTSGERRGDVR